MDIDKIKFKRLKSKQHTQFYDFLRNKNNELKKEILIKKYTRSILLFTSLIIDFEDDLFYSQPQSIDELIDYYQCHVNISKRILKYNI